MAKKRKEEAGTPKAPPLTKAMVALTQTEEVTPHSLATEQAPKGMVLEPQEESASAGQHAPEPPVLVMPERGS